VGSSVGPSKVRGEALGEAGGGVGVFTVEEIESRRTDGEDRRWRSWLY
jgi:hypothetical protein